MGNVRKSAVLLTFSVLLIALVSLAPASHGLGAFSTNYYMSGSAYPSGSCAMGNGYELDRSLLDSPVSSEEKIEFNLTGSFGVGYCGVSPFTGPITTVTSANVSLAYSFEAGGNITVGFTLCALGPGANSSASLSTCAVLAYGNGPPISEKGGSCASPNTLMVSMILSQNATISPGENLVLLTTFSTQTLGATLIVCDGSYDYAQVNGIEADVVSSTVTATTTLVSTVTRSSSTTLTTTSIITYSEQNQSGAGQTATSEPGFSPSFALAVMVAGGLVAAAAYMIRPRSYERGDRVGPPGKTLSFQRRVLTLALVGLVLSAGLWFEFPALNGGTRSPNDAPWAFAGAYATYATASGSSQLTVRVGSVSWETAVVIVSSEVNNPPSPLNFTTKTATVSALNFAGNSLFGSHLQASAASIDFLGGLIPVTEYLYTENVPGTATSPGGTADVYMFVREPADFPVQISVSLGSGYTALNLVSTNIGALFS